MHAPKTPEEEKWMASVLDPEKAKRRLKYMYIPFGIWIAVSIGWLIYLIIGLANGGEFTVSNGFTSIMFIIWYTNIILSIVNTRRIAAGKYPK